MKRKIQLKHAQKKDISFLIKGLQETRKISGWPKNKLKRRSDKKEYLREINKKRMKIVEINGERAAFIHFKTDFKVMYLEKNFWIAEVYVLKKFRKKGLGKLLYRDVIKIAKEKGFKKVNLDIFSYNKNSIAFHKKLNLFIRFTKKESNFFKTKTLQKYFRRNLICSAIQE